MAIRTTSHYRYIDKYRSKKTGKWVYVYDKGTDKWKHGYNDDTHTSWAKQLGDTKHKKVRSNSRKRMTDEERALDDRRHRSYNKKRMAKNAGNIFKNLGRAAKAVVTGKNAGKYLARSRKSALKTARNATNLATSYSGHTGKRTKTKKWIEQQLYGNKKGVYTGSKSKRWH